MSLVVLLIRFQFGIRSHGLQDVLLAPPSVACNGRGASKNISGHTFLVLSIVVLNSMNSLIGAEVLSRS